MYCTVPNRPLRGRPQKNGARLSKKKLVRGSWQARRAETRDDTLPWGGREKTHRIDLGLALLEYHALPGECYTCDEIALWCGCTNSAIYNIEQKALENLRKQLKAQEGDLWADLFAQYFEQRRPAERKKSYD